MRFDICRHLEMRGFEETTMVKVVGYEQNKTIGQIHGHYLVKFSSGHIGNAREEELFE